MVRSALFFALLMVACSLNVIGEAPKPTWTPVVVEPIHITIVVQYDDESPVTDCKAKIGQDDAFELGPDGKETHCITLGDYGCTVVVKNMSFKAKTDLHGPVADGSHVVFIIVRCPKPEPAASDAE